MQLPLQLTFHGLPKSESVAACVRKRVEKLGTFCPDIRSCRVAIESPHRHKQQGRPYRVRIDLGVPGDELVVSRTVGENSEDAYAAIDAAFEGARRILYEHARRRRGDVKRHETSKHGVVCKLFPYEGFGFIDSREGQEIYFHRNSVLNRAFARMRLGARVRFAEELGDDGIHASSVTLLRTHPRLRGVSNPEHRHW
jgi:cold shock CspA family protein/ribosome-associated translation inhibitor RaiA